MPDYLTQFNNLPPEEKKFFLTSAPMIEMIKSFAIYDIAPLSQNIAADIGRMYVGLAKLNILPQIIAQKVTVGPDIANGIAYEINKRIFNRFPTHFKDAAGLLQQWENQKAQPVISESQALQKVLEQEPWVEEILKEEKIQETFNKEEKAEEQKSFLSSLIDLTLIQAVKQFPEIGEQTITTEKIIIKGSSEPAKPSIRNWISDYTANLGQGKHDSMARGNYLFQSSNTKVLNSADRQKLAYILKSFDEGAPLTINKNTKQVVFSPTVNLSGLGKASASQAPAPTPSPVQPSPRFSAPPEMKSNDARVSFSSPQKLPWEKDQNQPYNPLKINPQNTGPNPRPLPRNVVNLKETNN